MRKHLRRQEENRPESSADCVSSSIGTQEPVGLWEHRLQKRRSSPFFTGFLSHSHAMGLQIRQKLSSLGLFFAIDAQSPTGS